MKEHFDNWHGHNHRTGKYIALCGNGVPMTYKVFCDYSQRINTRCGKTHLRVNGKVHLEIAGKIEIKNLGGYAVLHIHHIHSPRTRDARLSLIEKKLGVKLQQHGN